MKPRNNDKRNTVSYKNWFLSQLETWVSRASIFAALVGSLIFFKLLLELSPNLVPDDYPTAAALAAQHHDLLPNASTLLPHLVSPPTSPPDSRQPDPSPPDSSRPDSSQPDSSSPGSSQLRSSRVNDLAPRAGSPFGVDLANSFLPCKDYIKPGSSTHELDVRRYFKVGVADSELLHAAQDVATRPLPEERPRVAFLFIIRQWLPLAPVWERFFAGADPDEYSIYMHPSWWVEEFPKTSVFHNRSIPTKEVSRFTISLVDVVRRLLAFALLDSEKANMWFVLVSEACVPIRSFPYVYEYLMNSTTSFVEAFSPTPWYREWDPEPVFKKEELRKGELWMAMHRRHAGMVVGDVTFYRKFKADCRDVCTLDEEYAQTLLHCLDPQGIANRSVTYADWSNPNHGGSPLLLTAEYINSTFFDKIQRRTENLDGQYIDSSDDWNHTSRVCIYNGRPKSPCFLFARKFSGEKADVQTLLDLPKSILGY